MRLLAQNPLRYRRQILALKQFFAGRRARCCCSTTGPPSQDDLQLHSIAHGVIRLEQLAPDYGAERRRLRVIKFRGSALPRRLPRLRDPDRRPAGVPAPGRGRAPQRVRARGACRAASPSSTRCSAAASTAAPARCHRPGRRRQVAARARSYAVRGAAAQGEQAALFVFDEERRPAARARRRARHRPRRRYVEAGRLVMRAGRPGRAVARRVRAPCARRASSDDEARLVVIDSLNGYLNAMPEEQFLILHMHELLHLPEPARRGDDPDRGAARPGRRHAHRRSTSATCADAVVLLRFFEARRPGAAGDLGDEEARPARTRTRSASSGSRRQGLQLGEPLADFQGVLRGRAELRRRGRSRCSASRTP